MADIAGAEAHGRGRHKKPKKVAEEPQVIQELRDSGFKFGEVKEEEGKPKDRNLI